MSASSSSSAARVRPVGDDFEVMDTHSAEAKSPGTGEAAAAGQADAEIAASPKKRRKILPVLGLMLLGAAGWYGYDWWTNGRFLVSTDDAYIEGDIATISPKVSGYVAKVDVVANQHVKAGDPLVTLDDGDYRIAAEQAEAQIATQKLALSRFDAQISGAKASLAQSEAQKKALEATVRGAELAQKRASELQSKSFGTDASRDSAQVALDQARANLAGAEANIAAAKANITVLEAQRMEAESTIRSLELARDKADRDLGFTILKAPYDGVIGNVAVQVGDLVSAGQRLAALVPTDQLYIDANFKETQIAHLVPGSKVEIHVDAYEDHPIEGTVASISPASGSVFSLLPAENATGNFTKVIQRVPVRITLPADVLAEGHLRAGLSVVVDVDTRTAPEQSKVAAAK
ncbi:HlyD family efflux transporter periplasmic adaptor subunit [Sinorhizobium meliloti]|jgi:membrane fusion protein (multidrug efflux system)|uniref:HlyD family secretion protein n=1 Tax=Rhizobium meliloti TaxID=382 RepID=UPI001297B835|nr:HlyD family secretion protein [Sinorhizobium meliloti]MDW9594822.1 HlyD family efflux transporter periplasmic adaptor subunit [Sinorhizobium meliloti]MDX0190801.1 HlyD family efflux transporter periplasmic adaptor subunit [Sinorhizobium meliloti]MQV06224.1 HlyD family efflux transporter periplasmic adaptor subunit [Sinorhizobium meliloti]MQV57927.1 HlyD family efflux transporter periplasmic adaptor subunit [Sinorhizobium meliloti]